MPMVNGQDKEAQVSPTTSGDSKSAGVTQKKKKRPRNRSNRQIIRANRILAENTREEEEEEKLALANIMSTANTALSTQVLSPEQPIVDNQNSVIGKTREQIKAEREAKKQAKLAKKMKSANVATTTNNNNSCDQLPSTSEIEALNALANAAAAATPINIDNTKTREQIKAEREAKRLAKAVVKMKKEVDVATVAQQIGNLMLSTTTTTTSTSIQTPTISVSSASTIAIDKMKPALSKAERRAIQEAQRAAKAQVQVKTSKNLALKSVTKSKLVENAKSPIKKTKTSSISINVSNDGKVKLFNHLERANQQATLFVNNPLIHQAIARLGEQYAKRTIVGSNARCVAFLNGIKMVIQDFETPPKKEFARSLETALKYCVKHLQACRPLAVSVCNAYKHIKHVLTQLSAENPESECKEHLCQFIDTYIENQIGKAAEAISESMQEKIKNGDVILTFGW